MMVGSISIGYWIAHGAFWLLIALALAELERRTIAIVLALWVGGYLLFHSLAIGAPLFVTYVAVLDIVLVLAIFKGDVRLT